MANNISWIKVVSKKWFKSFKENIESVLKESEGEIERLHFVLVVGTLSSIDLFKLHSLEGLKHSILEKEEVAWCLKSRSIWIKKGDNNSKLFH
jgi:hypothetical protein